MYKVFACILMASTMISCKPDFKKGKKGIEYLIVQDGSGPTLKNGDFMEIHLGQYLRHNGKDSLMNDTRKGNMPFIESFDSTGVPPEYYSILSQLKKGDSLVMRVLVDSMFATAPGAMPPFVKSGDYFITTVRLLNIHSSQAAMEKARIDLLRKKQKADSLERIASIIKDEKTLQAYFAKNKITGLQRGMMGTYVKIIQPGTGPMIDTNVVVVTNYTGRTMDGNMFDSNTDSSKGHVEPFKVNMTNDPILGGGVIAGWMDGLRLLNKGAKAKFYIPSALAYGKTRMGKDIAENSILIFDIEVVDVLSRQQAGASIDSLGNNQDAFDKKKALKKLIEQRKKK
jgi:FKBP-type peptidyl-prolyl cis-trans isomerase FkpA